MNIGQIKEQALQLLDAYSENGYILSEEKPATADYVLRINGLINQALLRIITVYPVVRELDFEELESECGIDGVHYRLPWDFLELTYLRKLTRDDWEEGEFSILDRGGSGKELIAPYLSCPRCYYSALPALIPAHATDEEEIEVTEAGARLIPLYVAGMLVLEESSSLSTRLLNQFEGMLSQRLGEGVKA